MTDGTGQDTGLSGARSLARFQNWLGFLAATIVVNLLFIYGMLGNSGDATLGLWYKALIWLPFNSIASMLYYVFRIKLADATGGAFLGALCLVMIALNWIVMFFV